MNICRTGVMSLRLMKSLGWATKSSTGSEVVELALVGAAVVSAALSALSDVPQATANATTTCKRISPNRARLLSPPTGQILPLGPGTAGDGSDGVLSPPFGRG